MSMRMPLSPLQSVRQYTIQKTLLPEQVGGYWKACFEVTELRSEESSCIFDPAMARDQ